LFPCCRSCGRRRQREERPAVSSEEDGTLKDPGVKELVDKGTYLGAKCGNWGSAAHEMGIVHLTNTEIVQMSDASMI
jgi:hypothetical protein